MLTRLLAPLAIAGAAALAPASSASAAARIGTLECSVGAGVGLVVTSSRALNCVFQSRYRSEHYVGTIRRFGLDLGFTNQGHLGWAVFAATRPGPGALAGEYVGGSASATIGVGVGANALVGGFNRSFTFQPLSGEAQTGANIAAGVGALHLDWAPPPRRVRRHYRG